MLKTQRKPESRSAMILGVAIIALCIPLPAATNFKVLYNLPYPDDGVSPGVTVDQKGNVYGATGNGGNGKGCQDEYGCGLIFKLAPRPNGKWTFGLVHDFTGGSDGAFPNGNLVVDTSGNLWGASDGGGAHKYGTVFKLAPADGRWSESVLYNFCERPQCSDGSVPQEGVVRDMSGNVYGTAGAVAFQLSRESNGQWDEQVLHRFPSSSGDGSYPFAGLIVDAAGNLYGTTSYGGGGDGCHESGGCGTAFELSPQPGGQWKESILHRFDDNGDGYLPATSLYVDASGILYGTTEEGGSGLYGTVFRLSKQPDGSWKETILYNLNQTDLGPGGGVVMDKAGNLYGTITGGQGPCNCGAIYKLSPRPKGEWAYTPLHTFSGLDGQLPQGNLAIDSKGNLYGGTIFGGKYGNGVVFELTP